VGFTTIDEFVEFFTTMDLTPIQNCCLQSPEIAHNAFKVLVNISSKMNNEQLKQLSDEKFIKIVVGAILVR
jgi:hypothetical protein